MPASSRSTRSRTRKALVAATVALPLGLLAPTAAQASTHGPDTDDRAPVTLDLNPAASRVAAGSSDVSEPRVLAAQANQIDDRLWLSDVTRPVAPAVSLRSFEWLDAAGFMRGDLLKVDLAAGSVKPDYINNGKVASASPLMEQAEPRRAVAAVNGDYFDINNSNAPQGGAKQLDGTVVKGPNPGHNYAVGVGDDNLGRITSMFLQGSITLPTGAIALDGLNQAAIPADGVTVFTPLWGDYTRSRVTGGATKVREVVTRGGVVESVATVAGAGQLDQDQVAVVGRGAGADKLGALKVGDKVSVDYALRNEGANLKMAISGNTMLLKGGAVLPQTDKAIHPRTAIGFDADGSTMFVLTVDGRTAASRGMTYAETGAFLKEAGATTGINLDGGGSSTMLAREAGESDLDVENQPSDGGLRSVPDGVGLFAAAGSGEVRGLRLVTTSDEENVDLLRVFPGLTRQLTALGHDETYAPVAASPAYRAQGNATISGTGLLRASAPGDVVASAQIGGLKEDLPLTVLGSLKSLRPSVDKVSILDPAQPSTFRIVGADANGFETPLETGDVTLDHDPALVDVTRSGVDFTVRARPGVTTGAVVIKATAKGVVTHIPVAIGSVSTTLSTFDDASTWRFTQARAAGSVEPTAGREGGTGLRMTYDFTQSTATRVGYARPATPITITQGQPLALGVWVLGDGKGAWTSFGISDGEGKAASLYGPYITWTGWKYMEVPVPQTLPGPITLNFVAAIETGASRSYTGAVVFDDLVVKTAPPVSAPDAPVVADPVVQQHTALSTTGEQFSYAVMSDGQFTADNQSLVPAVRRTLREIVASTPDFVVITGDLVDTGYPADFALAKKVIDEELTAKGVKWYYLPGNHEIYGPGSTSNFSAVFGATHHSFVHRGTRFVLLDSSTGTLRGGGFDQWQMLRSALDDASRNDAVNGVVVGWHHPPRDPSPVKGSQMTDRVEAETVEGWLSDFRLRTGKGALFVGGHVGAFSAGRVDSVPYVVNGNSGKAPSTSPDEGGFSGWTTVRIDPEAPRVPAPKLYRVDPSEPGPHPWARVQIRPHVDRLTVNAPTVVVGARVPVTTTITQGTRTFPLAYPVSAAWSGRGVHIGTANVPGSAVAAYDPATGKLTGLRPGTGTLTVTVNGVSQEATVTVG
ncbi:MULTISPECIES: phosphodiester glycosidase family protein [unclassified Knoellia]|uniref:phosphodiester glycosidase family protein n=1 Tax=Knoellia altitudinis TaxID=3404795 RepID=UPI0036129EC9